MKKALTIVVALAVAIPILLAAIPELRAPLEGLFKRELSFDEAAAELDDLMGDVAVQQRLVRQRANLSEITKVELNATLPAIDKFPLVVAPARSGNDVVAELFVSSEKAGKAPAKLKFQKVVYPKIRFIDRNYEFVMDFLKRKLRDLCKRDINFIFLDDSEIITGLKFNINKDNMGLIELLDEVCKQAGVKYQFGKTCVIIRK